MSDNTYFLIMILFLAIFILGFIYRLLFNRFKSKGDKNAIEPTSTQDIEKEFDDDPVINPGYSSLNCNVFHKDRYDSND